MHTSAKSHLHLLSPKFQGFFFVRILKSHGRPTKIIPVQGEDCTGSLAVGTLHLSAVFLAHAPLAKGSGVHIDVAIRRTSLFYWLRGARSKPVQRPILRCIGCIVLDLLSHTWSQSLPVAAKAPLLVWTLKLSSSKLSQCLDGWPDLIAIAVLGADGRLLGQVKGSLFFSLFTLWICHFSQSSWQIV